MKNLLTILMFLVSFTFLNAQKDHLVNESKEDVIEYATQLSDVLGYKLEVFDSLAPNSDASLVICTLQSEQPEVVPATVQWRILNGVAQEYMEAYKPAINLFEVLSELNELYSTPVDNVRAKEENDVVSILSAQSISATISYRVVKAQPN